jgi:predicted DNA repair protein MutK
MFSKHPEATTTTEQVKVITPEELEKERVTGAVRTDIILSAEIMAIAYSQVRDQPIVNQILIMLAVAVFITIAVYGFVGFIVKLDDIGLHFAQKKYSQLTQKVGRGTVKFMPHFLSMLSVVGTAAMLWVGAEIIAHGIPFTNHLLHNLEHSLAAMPVVAWLTKVLSCAIGGLGIGFVVEKMVMLVNILIRKKA